MKRIPVVVFCAFALGCGSKPSESPESLAARVTESMSPAQLEYGGPVVNSVGMVLVPVRVGQFEMGYSGLAANRDAKPDRSTILKPLPAHKVIISKPFYICATEVTQSQWQKVMGTTPWENAKGFVEEGGGFPASCITWDAAVEFCKKLSELEKEEYRLPTEAEWEYACRAGTYSSFAYLHDDVRKSSWMNHGSVEAGADAYAREVALKLPNPWGLFDMHGNVGEWCADWFARYGGEIQMDPSGPENGKERIVRGGNAQVPYKYCGSGVRAAFTPDTSSRFLGFRPVKVHPADATAESLTPAESTVESVED